MKNISKILSVLLISMLLFGLTGTALAMNENTEGGEYHSELDMEAAEYYALTLNRDGLFKGTGTDAEGNPIFSLDKELSRAEALVMLIRLLGKEDEALNGAWEHPFTDVPGWADKYIGYAYQNGLTSGVSKTLFGNGRATARQYMTFVLRALGYSDEDAAPGSTLYKDAIAIGNSISGLAANEDDVYRLCLDDDNFLRADAVDLSYRALLTEHAMKDGGNLLEKLYEEGVFDNKYEEVEKMGIHHVEINVKDFGKIALELDGDTAPRTVANFLKLAQSGFYDGLTFHRIMDGFMIQGGDPEGTGYGGSPDKVIGEFAANGIQNDISHSKGVISMARSNDYNSASSQFFITVADAKFLDGNYAAFGRVTEGMDVAERIASEISPKAIDGNGSIAAADQPVIESVVVVD